MSVWSYPSTRPSCEPPIFRVAVVGGGLAGLALGQLLFNVPNIEVTVYERSVDSIDRLCGFRIMLSAPVLLKLRAHLPEEVWHKVEASIGVQPENGQEVAFLRRYI